MRDRGLISSVEFRVPVLFDKAGAGMLHLAPFFDFGGGWNDDGSPNPTTIYSTGMGLLFTLGKHFSAETLLGPSIAARRNARQRGPARPWHGLQDQHRSVLSRSANARLSLTLFHSDRAMGTPAVPTAGHILAWCDAPGLRTAGHPLFAGGSDQKRCCCIQAPLAKQIGTGFLQSFVFGSASIRSERLASASYQMPASA